MDEGERRLAVIMFTDMVGFTAMAQRNEQLAMELLEEQRSVVRPFLSEHRGREIKTIGDAFLVEFSSAVDATACGVDIQSALKETNDKRAEDRRIVIRIGIHLGEVFHDGTDIAGDAVNVASRIEPLAPPGGVCLTGQVRSAVLNRVPYNFESIGTPELKNVVTPIEVFRILGYGTNVAPQFSGATRLTNRIAVLPFANMSSDPGDEYFAEGMTEEVISTISKVKALKVISRTSVMRYRNSPKSLVEIGKELNVEKLLEGSVRKYGNKIRVTVQLIDARSDQHVWSESYDGDLKDVFDVQTDIAKQISEALQVSIEKLEMGRISRRPTDSISSYSLYLKGRFHLNQRSLESIGKAIEYFGKSTQEDPNFPLGYVGLADCFELLAGNWQIDIDANNKKAALMVDTALRLDRELAEAHATKGLTLRNSFNFEEAEEEFKAAVQFKPNYALAHLWYYQLLLAEMRIAEASEHIERAVELDPLLPTININLGIFYQTLKDYAKALDLYRRTVDLDPKFVSGHFAMGWAFGKLKMFDESKREYSRGFESLQSAYPLSVKQSQVWIAWLEDDRESVRKLLPELEAKPESTLMDSIGIAELHFYIGEVDMGFQWLERSYAKKEQQLMYIQSDEFLDGVRGDPRYVELVKKMGLRPMVRVS